MESSEVPINHTEDDRSDEAMELFNKTVLTIDKLRILFTITGLKKGDDFQVDSTSP